jgi:ribosomal protein S3
MEKSPEKKETKVSDIEEIKKRLAEDFNIGKVENIENIEEKEEKRSVLAEEKIIRDKLEKEVELMQTSSPQLQDEAQKKAQDIKELDAEGKLKGLFDLAQSKGLPFAITAAQTMDDPYILDVFHDLLIKQGFYGKFSE